MPRPVHLTMMTIGMRFQPMADRRAEILNLTEEAGRGGTRILLLPERADHHRTHEAMTAIKSGKQAVRETLSLTLDSPWMQQMAGLAKKHRMVVIPSIIERSGEKMFGSNIVFGPGGELLGTYRKTHLAPGEERTLDPGDHLDPIPTPFGNLGIFICWDIHFPEITRIYELKGADILLWSTMRHGPWEREFYSTILPARCLTHGLPLGVATFAAENQLADRQAMTSIILDSHGQTLAGGNREGHSLVHATVDLEHRPIINREWDSADFLDYPKFAATHRRTDLYGALLDPPKQSR